MPDAVGNTAIWPYVEGQWGGCYDTAIEDVYSRLNSYPFTGNRSVPNDSNEIFIVPSVFIVFLWLR